MMTDDMALVRDYVTRQSEQAFETLVDRYVNLVCSAAARPVRDPHLAEEITQAVFVVLARKAATLGSNTILPNGIRKATRSPTNRRSKMPSPTNSDWNLCPSREANQILVAEPAK
jgi:DNA-directed RNA polymerase specialized sigma24 family protein